MKDGIPDRDAIVAFLESVCARIDDEVEPEPAQPSRMTSQDILDEAREEVLALPIAVSGQHGHDALWDAAHLLVRGYDLTPQEAYPILVEYSQNCQPPWSEKELWHKLHDADNKGRSRRGWKLRGRNKTYTNGDQAAQYSSQRAGLESATEITTEPVEASGENDEHEPFPVECFPDVLVRFAREVAESMSCPIDMPAAAMLVVASTAIGASRAIKLKRVWVECPRFYLAIISEPGTAKTPAVNAVCRPIFEHQRRSKEEWDERVEQWKERKRDHEHRKKQGEPGLTDPGSRPKLYRCHTTDPTTEALAPILSQNPRGIIVVKDEITAWVLSMNQYKGGKGSDRQFWLSSWSGEPGVIDRKSSHEEGPVVVPHPFINVLGGIPPDMLKELCDERAREDGFIHRLLFCYPTASYGLDWTETEVSIQAEEDWAQAVGRLFALEMSKELDKPDRPVLVPMDEGAKQKWELWYNYHAAEMRHADFRRELLGPWSKFRSYTARMALTIHLLRLVCGEVSSETIDEESMIRAAALADYFKSHARRAYKQLHVDALDKQLDQLLQWIDNHGGHASTREIFRNGVAGIKGAKEARRFFDQLEDRGYGKTNEVPSQHGKPSYQFQRRLSNEPE